MAYQNKLISNPKTGQSIRFLKTAKDTDGQLLEMESIYHSFSKEPVAHYHPEQDENFEVLQGKLHVLIGKDLQILTSGEKLHIPKGQEHAMWNLTGETTIVNWQVRPALDTEYFLETVMGIATHGKTNKEGMPNLLQTALIATRFARVFRIASPPYIVQKTLFGLLTPFAKIIGYRPEYQEHIN